MRIISVLAVLLISLTGCANQSPTKVIQTPTVKPTLPSTSTSNMASPTSSPGETPTPRDSTPTPISSFEKSPRAATPSPKVTKSPQTNQPTASTSVLLNRLSTAVMNAPFLVAGSYVLTTPDSITRKVTWRSSDMTYLALDAGREFGWAYFNGTYYEDYTARFQTGFVGSPTLRWFEGPPALAPNPHTILDIPQILAADIAREAVAVSVSKNSWTIIGRVHTSVYTSSELQYETMQFDSFGHLTTISLPGLNLTITTKAPDPLIKADEMSGPGGSASTPQR